MKVKNESERMKETKKMKETKLKIKISEVKKKLLSLVLIIGILSASSVCDVAKFKLEWGNWSNLALVSILISLGFISLIYMIGSFIGDDELKSRANIEYGQLLLTVIIIILLFSIVEFLCSDAIGAALLGGPAAAPTGKSMVDYTEGYFRVLANYSAISFYSMAGFYAILAYLSSYEPSMQASTFKFFNLGTVESIDIIKATLSFFFSIILGSYILSIANRFILYYSILLGLYFFIPLGIVMRSLFPLRRFGGALLGIGIALVLFFPFIFFMNAVFLTSVFEDKIKDLLPQAYCNTDSAICYSKVCNVTVGLCDEQLDDEEICYNSSDPYFSHYSKSSPPLSSELNLRCKSGRCEIKKEATPTGIVFIGRCVKAEALLDAGKECKFHHECKPGLYCNSTTVSPGICRITKEIGESCTYDEECEKGRGERACIGGVCNYTKKIGDDCSKHTECSSLYCNASNKCDYSKLTASIFDFDKFREGEKGGVSSVVKSIPVVGDTLKIVKGIIETISLVVIATYALSMVNYMLLGYVMRDLSGFFGMEVSLEDIYRLI